MRNYPQSGAQHHQKWKGPYRILKQLGPLNHCISLESTGEDVRKVHVSNLKPCFPMAAELEQQQRRKKQNFVGTNVNINIHLNKKYNLINKNKLN